MYNDEELMLFAESYQKTQRKGTAGKKIIGTVSERLNESIDSQIKTAKLKKMVKALLECEKMKGAKKFLKSISLTECKAKDFAKVEKLYKLYEEIEDVKEEDEKEVDENIHNEFMDTMRDISKQVKKGGKIYEALIETICYAIENLDEVSLDPPEADFADSLYQAAMTAYEDIKKYAEEAELYNESDDEEEVEEAEEEEVEEAEDDDADGDPDVAVIKSGFISDYKSDKLSLYKFLQAIVEFGQWIMTHGKNEERNVMKSLLAVLEDEFIPKFAELPGATDDSTVDDEPAADADEEIPADAEDDEEDVDVEVDDEEPTEDEEDMDIDVDLEDDEEPADESEDEEEDIELDVEESEDDEEVTEADGDIIEISVPSIYHEPDEAKKLIKQFKKKYNVDAEFYDGGDQYSSWTFSGKRENLKKLFNGYFETTKDDDDEELASCVLDDDDVPLLKKILA